MLAKVNPSPSKILLTGLELGFLHNKMPSGDYTYSIFMKFIPFFSYHAKMYTALVLLYYALVLDYFFQLSKNVLIQSCVTVTNRKKKIKIRYHS